MTVATYEQHPPAEIASAHVEPGQNLITWAQALGSAHQIAKALCTTSFVPRHFAGKPDEAAAALMLGDELGLSPVSALRSIFVIGGTPGMYARTMVALVQSRGHEVWTETDTPTKVVVCGKRAGSDRVERSEWTIDRARRAGYTNNKKYETDPQAMLYARAASDVCRRIAADVLSGIPHSVEELETVEAEKPTRKVQRKTERPAPAEPEFDERPASTQVTAEQVTTPEPALDDAEPMVTRAQLAKIGAAMSALGITDRDNALLYVSDVVGRQVASRNELTKAEASALIDALERDEQGPTA